MVVGRGGKGGWRSGHRLIHVLSERYWRAICSLSTNHLRSGSELRYFPSLSFRAAGNARLNPAHGVPQFPSSRKFMLWGLRMVSWKFCVERLQFLCWNRISWYFIRFGGLKEGVLKKRRFKKLTFKFKCLYYYYSTDCHRNESWITGIIALEENWPVIFRRFSIITVISSYFLFFGVSLCYIKVLHWRNYFRTRYGCFAEGSIKCTRGCSLYQNSTPFRLVHVFLTISSLNISSGLQYSIFYNVQCRML